MGDPFTSSINNLLMRIVGEAYRSRLWHMYEDSALRLEDTDGRKALAARAQLLKQRASGRIPNRLVRERKEGGGGGGGGEGKAEVKKTERAHRQNQNHELELTNSCPVLKDTLRKIYGDFLKQNGQRPLDCRAQVRHGQSSLCTFTGTRHKRARWVSRGANYPSGL